MGELIRSESEPDPPPPALVTPAQAAARSARTGRPANHDSRLRECLMISPFTRVLTRDRCGNRVLPGSAGGGISWARGVVEKFRWREESQGAVPPVVPPVGLSGGRRERFGCVE